MFSNFSFAVLEVCGFGLMDWIDGVDLIRRHNGLATVDTINLKPLINVKIKPLEQIVCAIGFVRIPELSYLPLFLLI